MHSYTISFMRPRSRSWISSIITWRESTEPESWDFLQLTVNRYAHNSILLACFVRAHFDIYMSRYLSLDLHNFSPWRYTKFLQLLFNSLSRRRKRRIRQNKPYPGCLRSRVHLGIAFVGDIHQPWRLFGFLQEDHQDEFRLPPSLPLAVSGWCCRETPTSTWIEVHFPELVRSQPPDRNSCPDVEDSL